MSDSFETPSRMEPCRLEAPSGRVFDLVTEITREAEKLGNRLHPITAGSLADLVRALNCHYSNLIEGHNTSLREIEAALKGKLSSEKGPRNLQLEARAHIHLQGEIDRMHAAGNLPETASTDFILRLHREFYRDATEEMLTVTTGKAGGRSKQMIPGTMRSVPGEDEVEIGNHVPPSPERVADFMTHFENRFRIDQRHVGARIMAIPAAHHRFNFIHPFLDGNGRVSRLMSHAMCLAAGIGAHGLWSVSRGLSRGLTSGIEGRGEYRRMMSRADMVRQGDLDGRGNLSLRALTEFTEWFLEICLDQIRFMGGLFALGTLFDRLRRYVELRELKPGTLPLLEQILIRGEVPRGDAPGITGLRDRAARALLASLLDDGIVGSDTPKGEVSLRFPASSVEVLFPTLHANA